MPYDYTKERPGIFTEEGVKMLCQIRDNARELIGMAGAATAGRIINKCSGDSWRMLACVDYLVETKELREVPTQGWGQDRVFVMPRRD